jgi:hypothetical protein
VGVVFAETRPTCAPKNAKRRVGWLNLKESEHGRLILKNGCRHTIYKVARRKEGFIPIMERKGRMGEQGKACFH